jgi:fatty acid desaturase
LSQGKSKTELPAEFYQISTYRGLARVLMAWIGLIYLITVAERINESWAYIVVLFLIAWIILFIDETNHRAMHRTLFHKESWHSFFQAFYSLPLFRAIVPGKHAHQWSHEHCYLYADPERAMSTLFGMPAGRHTPDRTFFYLIVAPFFGNSTLMELSRINRCLLNSKGYRKRILSFWAAVFLVFTVLGALELLWWYWIVPLVFIAPIPLTWLRLSRHYKTTQPHYSRDIGKVFSWILFGGAVADYTAHMLYPSVPHYKLTEVTDRYLQEEPRIVATNFLQLTQQICGADPEATSSAEPRKAASS